MKKNIEMFNVEVNTPLYKRLVIAFRLVFLSKITLGVKRD